MEPCHLISSTTTPSILPFIPKNPRERLFDFESNPTLWVGPPVWVLPDALLVNPRTGVTPRSYR
eukprot:scaffold3289_cov163-Amphora_coffeaeformis.AAC.9